MWPRGVWRRAVRAGDPRGRRPGTGARRRPTRTAMPTVTRIATCWWSAPARRGWRRRWRPPRGRRAGHPVRRAGGAGRLAAGRARARPSTASPRRTGSAETLATPAASVTLLPRTTAFGWYPDNMIGLVQRVTDHLAAPARGAAARAVVAGARRAGGDRGRAPSSGRWCFPATTGRASCWPTRRGVYLTAMACGPATRVVVATAAGQRLPRGACAARAPGPRSPRIVDGAPTPGGSHGAKTRARGRHPVHAGTQVIGHQRPAAGAARSARCGRQRRRDMPCDTVLMSGGWTPSVHLFSQSRGRLRFEPGAPTCPVTPAAGSAVAPVACDGTGAWRGLAAMGARGGACEAPGGTGDTSATSRRPPQHLDPRTDPRTSRERMARRD